MNEIRYSVLLGEPGSQCTSRSRRLGGSIAPLFGYSSVGAREGSAGALAKIIGELLGIPPPSGPASGTPPSPLAPRLSNCASSSTVSGVVIVRSALPGLKSLRLHRQHATSLGRIRGVAGNRVVKSGPPFDGNPPTR